MSFRVGNDIFTLYGRKLIYDSLKERSGGDQLPSNLLNLQARSAIGPVGILGAGASGLYTALILDDLGIPYEIIEARNRVGGRLYTHEFPDKTGDPYNYFDVGAMRFPKIDAMKRVFHLFAYPPLNTPDIALKSRLKEYKFKCLDAFYSYHGVTVKQGDVPQPPDETFHAQDVIEDTAPADRKSYVQAGAKRIMDDVIEPFANAILEDFKNGITDGPGLNYLMSFDKFSTRAYMSLRYQPSAELQAKLWQDYKLNLPNTPLPTDVVNWLETFDKSTGWYDRALSETVLEAIAFGWSPESETSPKVATEWKCIDGGAFKIADSMARYIRSRKPESEDPITLNKRVTSIGLDTSPEGAKVMKVVTDGGDHHQFSHVISTIPLPVMRTVDLRKAGLTLLQSDALRQLDYGPSIKIGMQFKTAWWTLGVDKDKNPLKIVGGQTYSDSPLRTVVYPSFGDVGHGKTTTLIASYCWTEDAERLGTLIDNNLKTDTVTGNCDKVLVDLVIKELSTLHNVTEDFLRGQLLDTYGWNWSRDPYTMGAFAFFGPGKFGSLYKSLNKPAADGHLFFAGEALSVRHAWVEGALDSAWSAVNELLLELRDDSLLQKFYENWGMNDEWFRPNTTVPRDSEDAIEVQKLLKECLLAKHIGYFDMQM